jgi:hypothetical protein
MFAASVFSKARKFSTALSVAVSMLLVAVFATATTDVRRVCTSLDVLRTVAAFPIWHLPRVSGKVTWHRRSRGLNNVCQQPPPGRDEMKQTRTSPLESDAGKCCLVPFVSRAHHRGFVICSRPTSHCCGCGRCGFQWPRFDGSPSITAHPCTGRPTARLAYATSIKVSDSENQILIRRYLNGI